MFIILQILCLIIYRFYFFLFPHNQSSLNEFYLNNGFLLMVIPFNTFTQ